MKRLLLAVLLLNAFFVNAQITLLHTFEDGISACSPTIIEDVGLYYYTTDSIDDYANYHYHYTTYYYYDSEFNLYKSFQFQVARYSGISLFPTRHLIDSDDELEFIVSESTMQATGGSSTHSYIMEEDGTIVYDFTNGDHDSFEFKLVNNEIRLFRSVAYFVASYTADDTEMEIYGTGGNYSAEEFHLVTNSVAYPNPARNNIILPYELEDGETTTMTIYNLNGQLIERFDIGSHFNQLQLNVSSYSPGIYLYEYKGRSNKFIVQ